MRRTAIAILAVLALASMFILGCGGAAGSQTVAEVQGRSIAKATLQHWVAIKRSEAQPSPTPVSPAQLTREALAFLITAMWLQGEASAQGIQVSPSEVRATYTHLLDGPAGEGFAARLKQRGMSEADERLQLLDAQLAVKLQSRLAAGPRALRAFLAAYRQRWRQRTICSPGYVIAECRNGPPLPPTPGGG